MRTWLDFEEAGFAIERSPRDYPKLVGPESSPLLEDLRFEIASRLELVGDGDMFATYRAPSKSMTCAHCGDRARNFGTCGLCELARAKALRARAAREGRAA